MGLKSKENCTFRPENRHLSWVALEQVGLYHNSKNNTFANDTKHSFRLLRHAKIVILCRNALLWNHNCHPVVFRKIWWCRFRYVYYYDILRFTCRYRAICFTTIGFFTIYVVDIDQRKAAQFCIHTNHIDNSTNASVTLYPTVFTNYHH